MNVLYLVTKWRFFAKEKRDIFSGGEGVLYLMKELLESERNESSPSPSLLFLLSLSLLSIILLSCVLLLYWDSMCFSPYKEIEEAKRRRGRRDFLIRGGGHIKRQKRGQTSPLSYN